MNFRLLVCLALLSFLPSCVYHGVNAPPTPTPGTQVQGWPGKPFTEVRGYCYDYTAETDRSFFVNGRMHKGVMDPKGVKLSPAQATALLKAITTSHDKQARTPCYKPHHAFVFYDAGGKVVGLFEMCFGCNKFHETPNGLPEYVDTPALQALVRELGLPLGDGNQFYTDACSRRS